MIRLSSDLAQLGKPVREAVHKAEKEGSKGPLWPIVLPMAPLPDPLKFLAEEMALVLSMDDKLFNDMAALDDLHKSTVALFDLYGEKRNALTATLHPAAMEGNKGAVLLTREERARMQPQSVELDILIHEMRKRTGEDGTRAWNCLAWLHVALEKEFELKASGCFVLPRARRDVLGPGSHKLGPFCCGDRDGKAI